MKIGWYRCSLYDAGYDPYDHNLILRLLLDGVAHQEPEHYETYLTAYLLMYPFVANRMHELLLKEYPEHFDYFERLLILI